MKSLINLRIYHGGWRNVTGYENLREINLISIFPVRCVSNFICLQPGDHEFITTIGVNYVRLLQDPWSLSDCRIRATIDVATMALRGACTADPNAVPDGIVGRTNLSIPRDPLLLTAWSHFASDIHVSHISTTCKSCTTPIIILEQLKVTVDLDSSERGSLRYSPEHWSTSCWCHHNILSTSPKVVKCTNFIIEVTILDHEIAQDGVGWFAPETMNCGIVTNFHV